MNDKDNKLILYKDDEGKVSVNIGNIYADGELEEGATRKKFFLVCQESSWRWRTG